MESIVIIGGGQAAAFAAQTLRKEGFEGTLSIISDEEKIFYERPPLSKSVLAGEESPEILSFFSPEAIDALNIDWHKPKHAEAIDRDAQTVTLNDGTTLPYDRLILATGSRPRVPNANWTAFENVHTLRTIDDSLKLQAAFKAGKRLAIIGGGWIGLEVAATANKLGLNVNLFELAPRLCGRSAPPEVSEYLYNLHTGKGTNIHLNCGAIDLAENADGTLTLTTECNEVNADIVLVGAGAEIATELAENAGLEIKGGIIVDEFGQTSDPNIYAAGDVAIHPVVGFCTQSWANAQYQAMIAAKAIMGKNPPAYGEIPWVWSDQYDHNIQIMSLPIDEECTLIIRDSGETQKAYIHLDSENRVRSIVAINDPKVIGIGRMWFKRNMVLDPEKLADTSIDVMTLR